MKRISRRAIPAAIALWLTVCASAAPAVVIVVRHAEKAAAPADDPPLAPAGAQRAAELARVVEAWAAGGAGVRGLFASEVRRTHQTLEPVAAQTGLRITVVPAKDTAALVKQILAIQGGIVVVAGHSNTVPGIVEALGGPAGIVMGDAEYDSLFAITGAGATPHFVALRYGLRSPENSPPADMRRMK